MQSHPCWARAAVSKATGHCWALFSPSLQQLVLCGHKCQRATVRGHCLQAAPVPRAQNRPHCLPSSWLLFELCFLPSGHFTWEKYLKETCAVPAPAHCFKQVRG